MIESILGKIILSPVTALYGIGISVRNILFKTELLKSTRFSIPTISVGNLTVGGAGKTPHIEYLIRLLNPYLNIGTLSRGYKRKTSGFRWVNPSDSVLDAGDEPMMYARKYKEISVAVAENRAIAIPQMVSSKPDLQTILLDDAFQHRSITPGLNILLTTYALPFTRDYLLPSGRLREWRSAYERADIIIVSKCPEYVSEENRQALISEIKPKDHQKIFFTYYNYQHPYSFFDPNYRIRFDKKLDVILISAIANTNYLLDYLEREVGSVHHLNYEDHHLFTDQDMEYIASVFEHRETPRKLILTTEKDAIRLDLHRKTIVDKKLPIFVLQVSVAFHFNQKEEFDELLKQYLLNVKI